MIRMMAGRATLAIGVYHGRLNPHASQLSIENVTDTKGPVAAPQRLGRWAKMAPPSLSVSAHGIGMHDLASGH